jgi:hypothetical protein
MDVLQQVTLRVGVPLVGADKPPERRPEFSRRPRVKCILIRALSVHSLPRAIMAVQGR